MKDIFLKKEPHDKNKPCYQCTIRFYKCHSKCPFYRNSKKKKEEPDYEYYDYVAQAIKRMKKSRRRRK